MALNDVEMSCGRTLIYDVSPFTMTNKGLRIELLLEPTETEDISLAPLKGGETVVLSLRRVGGAEHHIFQKPSFVEGRPFIQGPNLTSVPKEQPCLSNQKITKSLSRAVRFGVVVRIDAFIGKENKVFENRTIDPHSKGREPAVYLAILRG